ncbi:MAG TPA: hypothetical protein PKA00_13730 [Saprospiraceae bacterium]|nr:hypothetical protein [Saprospiraceae bacterium]HMQ83971.1 hypothetical protein [Saprospiraceae bacterium]
MEDFLSEINKITADWGLTEWITCIGGGMIVLILISWLVSMTRVNGRKRRVKQAAPQITVNQFKISPLGRDAYFKLQNSGPDAQLTRLEFKGRNNILVKNDVAGHLLANGESYRILLELTGGQKIYDSLFLTLTYLDKTGNVFEQVFDLNTQTSKQPKVIKFA